MPTAQPERRRMQRCELEEPVTIKFWNHGPREITGTVLNASPDGILLESDREIPPYTLVELVFLFPATLRSPGVRFLCQCHIVRHRSQGSSRHRLALAIVRTESERLARREAQPAQPWSSPDLALAQS